MDVKINTQITATWFECKIGEYNLSNIISEIYNSTLSCVQKISIERQSDNPDLEYIDVDLYRILDLIEKIRRY